LAESIVKPANPTKASDSVCNTYSFKSWTPEITNVTGDAIYTATFTCTSPKTTSS
jgi:hypothetical protein